MCVLDITIISPEGNTLRKGSGLYFLEFTVIFFILKYLLSSYSTPITVVTVGIFREMIGNTVFLI